MSFEVSVICDSISHTGARITTFKLKYPRFITPEFLTHREFSRNSGSSRAIPNKRMRKKVLQDCFVPRSFGQNQPGMQEGPPLPFWRQMWCKAFWKLGSWCGVFVSSGLSFGGAHKQYANRPLEPYMFIEVVCTSTSYNNFFALRDHFAAQPEIQQLARMMKDALDNSYPNVLNMGEWHLPFILETEKDLWSLKQCIKVSVARCARTSYETVDGTQTTVAKDIGLFNRLLSSVPLHASPAEHQATPAATSDERSGNFTGWIQYRKTLPHEYIR